MRERLIAYVSELTSGRRDREAVIEKALRRYDSELAAGKGPEEALGFAMATLEKERELRAEPQPKPAPAVQRPRELAIGENRWKLRGALRAVRVNYSYGKIRLESHKGSEILLREKNLTEDSEPARFVFEKGILTVEFTGKKPVRRIVDSIRDAIMPRRTLEILVPEGPASGLMEIKLSSQSADFSVSRISAEVFECETASGDAKLEFCGFESAVFSSSSGNWESGFSDIVNLNLDTSSGNARVGGKLRRVLCETASGDLELTSDTVLEELDFSSASGGCRLMIPKNSLFTAELKLGAGGCKVGEFDGFFLGAGAERKYICGKNGGKYRISSASGKAGIFVNHRVRTR